MTRTAMTKRCFAGGLAACALLLTSAALAKAHDYAVGALKISHPWARPTPNGASTAAGYLTVSNAGATPDRLVAVSSPAAQTVQIHQDSMAGGIMRMRPIPDGVLVPAHGVVTLAPGGYHLMFFTPKRPFKIGDRAPVTLRFEHAGALRVKLTVEEPAIGAGAMSGMDMPGMR